MEIVDCPTCGAPAEVQPWTFPRQASVPVQHVQTLCVRQHSYLLPRDMLVPVP